MPKFPIDLLITITSRKMWRSVIFFIINLRQIENISIFQIVGYENGQFSLNNIMGLLNMVGLIKKCQIAMNMLIILAIGFGCSNQQIIPSTNPDMYAKSVVDSHGISSKELSHTNLLGPTSYPSGIGHKNVKVGSGWIVVDMGKNSVIVDEEGPDFRIYESDNKFNIDWKDDLYKVYVSNDNKKWHDLGYGRGTDEFDLATKNLKEARYVKIKGFTEGSSSVNAGPDIEAIESLHSIVAKQEKSFKQAAKSDVELIALSTDLNASQKLGSISENIDFGNYYALVIGNNNYLYIKKLKTAENDAREVANILTQYYGYNVNLKIDATRADFLLALNQLRQKLTQSDNLLIYYAGHGWMDEQADEGYWLPVDAMPDNNVNWIANSSITSQLKAIEAKHILIVSDSCYSGKLGRGLHLMKRTPSYLLRISQRKARSVLSSGGIEPVMDGGGKANHSVFASAFIDALKENTEIMDGTQLFSKIRRPVMLNSDQSPEYSDIRKAGHEGGDFLFVRAR